MWTFRGTINEDGITEVVSYIAYLLLVYSASRCRYIIILINSHTLSHTHASSSLYILSVSPLLSLCLFLTRIILITYVTKYSPPLSIMYVASRGRIHRHAIIISSASVPSVDTADCAVRSQCAHTWKNYVSRENLPCIIYVTIIK